MAQEFAESTTARSTNRSRINWLSSINWQIDFSQRSSRVVREDAEFDWKWHGHYRRYGLRGFVKQKVARMLPRFCAQRAPGFSQEWLNQNSALLWEARRLLEDDLSKLLFDSTLVLRCSSHRQFYYPRIDFEDFVAILDEKPFLSKELPVDYLGLPLRVFTVKLRDRPQALPLTVVSTKVQINLLNSYRQYFIRRDSFSCTPNPGNVVLDCGACIGEISIILAGLVGNQGEVHLFDPVPLHARYCRLQASLNPTLAHVLQINVLAVDEVSKEVSGVRSDSSSIAPGGLSIDSFCTTTLDDYVSKKNLSRLDMVKMDIEGAEMNALEGATEVIRRFRPQLAISAYHRPEHLWEIPQKLKLQNGNYKLFFGHHSPIEWESVYYASESAGSKSMRWTRPCAERLR